MKKLLFLMAGILLPMGDALAQGYTWTINNTTGGTVRVVLLRRGTTRGSDLQRAVTLAPGQTNKVKTGGPTALGYCVIGVIAIPISGEVQGLSQIEKSFSLTCGDREVSVNHVERKYLTPQAGEVQVFTGSGAQAQVGGLQFHPGTGKLDIRVT